MGIEERREEGLPLWELHYTADFRRAIATPDWDKREENSFEL